LLHNIDISVVSECLCHLRAQYPILSPDICIGQQNLRIDPPISRLEWLCIEDDFGFVIKDFVKPTAEGRKFINGNSHHQQTIFKSILFGETIRLRRLNQRKDDYLSSLNRLREKAIRSKFPLNMTNDMIALASNWEDRLRPQNATRKKTYWFGLHLFPICLL